MSIDKSLKMKGKLVRPRNVFTRIERIKILKDEGKWEPTMSVFGIPKVKAVKIKRKGKSEKKVAKAEAADATPAATATPAAAPAGEKGKTKK
ncbi:MAG TPA: small basic protein [Candidatus Brocadiaceae bacterium]|nr:small basic protein [Candidatus Brocadiaceae bacterium]